MAGHGRTSEPEIKISETRPGAERRAVRALLPYMWPQGDVELKARVVIAMVLLVAAKVATVAIPAVFGRAVDALEGASTAGSVAAVPVGPDLAVVADRLVVRVSETVNTPLG